MTLPGDLCLPSLGCRPGQAVGPRLNGHATMTPRAALTFLRRHGIVLEGGHGPVPNFAEAVAGAPIRGSWWGHPKAREIFPLTRALRDSAGLPKRRSRPLTYPPGNDTRRSPDTGL
jgi:hypothetical protein